MAFVCAAVQPKPTPTGARREADEPRILHRRLPVLDRFAVDGVADHRDESGDARVLGDEAEIPALLRWSDQHLLEAAAPDDRSAEARENRLALPPVSRISLGPGRVTPVRIGRMSAQFDQIEHMDRAGPVVGAEGGEASLVGSTVPVMRPPASAGDPQKRAPSLTRSTTTRVKRQTKTRGFSESPSAGNRRRVQARSTKRRR